MKRIYLFLFVFVITVSSCDSQVEKMYSFPGMYKNKTAQGMAIYENSAFLLNDEGYCRIYNLKSKKLISEFHLASADTLNHANCASFGVEFPKNNKKYPAIYVSECKGDFSCFVESIDENGSHLIQTLKVKTKGQEHYSVDWIVDKEQKCIYTVANPSKEIDSTGTRNILITKLSLPSIHEGNIVFTEKDIIEQFEIKFANLLQGGIVRNNYLYLPVGLHLFKGSGKRKDKNRAIIIVNLKTKRIEKNIDINKEVKNEPEDVDFYKNHLILYCGQEGGLYKIKYNE
jgi:hypothetical protein